MDARPGVVGHEGKAVGGAHVERGLEGVVVGVGDVAEGIADALEGEWLQEGCETLARVEDAGVRRADTRVSVTEVCQGCAGVGQIGAYGKIFRIELIGPEAASVAAIGLEEVTLRTDVADARGKCVGPLMLEAKAPVDVLGSAAAKVRIGIAHAGRGTGEAAGCGIAGTEGRAG